MKRLRKKSGPHSLLTGWPDKTRDFRPNLCAKKLSVQNRGQNLRGDVPQTKQFFFA